MQRSTRKVVVLLFALATVTSVAYAVHISLNPDYYFFRRLGDRANWTYDPGSVAFVCGVMLVEALVACLAIMASRPKALWLRCLMGLLLLGPWSLFSTMLVVHMPGYTLFHHLWVWLLVFVLIVAGVASSIRQLYLRLRGGSPNNSFKPNPLRGSA